MIKYSLYSSLFAITVIASPWLSFVFSFDSDSAFFRFLKISDFSATNWSIHAFCLFSVWLILIIDWARFCSFCFKVLKTLILRPFHIIYFMFIKFKLYFNNFWISASFSSISFSVVSLKLSILFWVFQKIFFSIRNIILHIHACFHRKILLKRRDFFCFTAENLLKKLEECENFSQKWWKFLGRNPFRLSKDGRELFTGAEIKSFLDLIVKNIF